MSTVTKNVSNAQGIPQAAAPAAPAYQHRHRPDPAQANPPQPPRKYDPDAAARRKAALAELAALGSPEKTSKENESVETRGDTSAGSSGQTVPDARPPTRPVGGLHHGDAVSYKRRFCYADVADVSPVYRVQVQVPVRRLWRT